jgi:hypothetical protein
MKLFLSKPIFGTKENLGTIEIHSHDRLLHLTYKISLLQLANIFLSQREKEKEYFNTTQVFADYRTHALFK